MQIITDKTDKNFKWIDKKIDIDVAKANFELDALQTELINRYIRSDNNFKRAFFTNWTPQFFQFIKDKSKLNEPFSIAVIGTTRGGKSTSAITIAGLTLESRGRLMTTELICSSQYNFMDKLKLGKSQFGDCFVIDEDKQSVYGTGSVARKSKLSDVQNIIAVNNISTLWLRPDAWAWEGANYGIRAFGRGQFFKDGTKMPLRITRFMLYNLQESSAGGSLPLGMVYIPHFADILKNGKELWEEYSKKKQDWVDEEQQGRNDNIIENQFKTAEKICNHPKFKTLKGSNVKRAFITSVLGSEVTKGECEQIFQQIKLVEQGFTIDEIRNFMKNQ